MIYVPAVVIVIIVVAANLWLYVWWICLFACRTSVRSIANLHRSPTDPLLVAPYRSVIAYERHRS